MIQVGQLVNTNPKDKTVIEARKIPELNQVTIEEKSKHCKIMIVNKKSIQSGDPDRGQYVVEFQIDTDTLLPQSKVKVMCTCHNFNFQWAYVLNKKEALINPKNRFDYAITHAPKVTNPNQQTGCCKHVQFCINELLSRSMKDISQQQGEI